MKVKDYNERMRKYNDEYNKRRRENYTSQARYERYLKNEYHGKPHKCPLCGKVVEKGIATARCKECKIKYGKNYARKDLIRWEIQNNIQRGLKRLKPAKTPAEGDKPLQ